MLSEIRTTLVGAVKGVSGGIADIVPDVFVAIVLALLGWLFGSAVGKVVSQLVATAKPEPWLEKAGVTGLFARAGYHIDLAALLGWLARAFFIVVFLVAAFDVLGLAAVNDFLVSVLEYLPKVAVAIFILFVAALAADVVGSVVSGTAHVAGGRIAGALRTMARWAIWVFAIVVALSELGVAPQYMLTLFTGFVAMLALAGGLAFGLGGKEAAAEFITDVRAEMRGKR
jgi:hypothetical protein